MTGKIKKLTKKIKLPLFLKEAGLLVFTHFFGLLTFYFLTTTTRGQVVVQDTQSQVAPESSWMLLVYFAVVTLLFYILVRFWGKKGGSVFKVIFAIAIFSGIDIVFATLIGEPWAVLIALLLVSLRFSYSNVWVHNITIALAVAGAAARLGIGFEPASLIVVLALLAFYDIIAVYWTKHMVKIAKSLTRQGVFFGFIVPRKDRNTWKLPENINKNKNFLVLGAGDLALPLLFAVGVAGDSLLDGVMISLFSLLGLMGMHIIFNLQEKLKPMPALPPMALGAALGYIFVLFL
jgi:presenilin-like A22 family membrane protease